MQNVKKFGSRNRVKVNGEFNYQVATRSFLRKKGTLKLMNYWGLTELLLYFICYILYFTKNGERSGLLFTHRLPGSDRVSLENK